MNKRQFTYNGTAIAYKFAHANTNAMFSEEEAEKFMSPSDPPTSMLVHKALKWTIDRILDDNKGKVVKDIEEIMLLFSDEKEVVSVSYKLVDISSF